MHTEPTLLAYLDSHDIPYRRFEHPAVFTCAEAEMHRPLPEAVSTKNLFLCDKKARRFFLMVTDCEKTIDLAGLSGQTGVSHLRFASEANLARLLGVGRGSVTMLGLVNDSAHQVELWIDAGIWSAELFQSHPLVNTATLLLKRADLERFFALTGHTPRLVVG